MKDFSDFPRIRSTMYEMRKTQCGNFAPLPKRKALVRVEMADSIAKRLLLFVAKSDKHHFGLSFKYLADRYIYAGSTNSEGNFARRKDANIIEMSACVASRIVAMRIGVWRPRIFKPL